LDYLEGSNNPIEDWYQGLSEEGQDLFDGLIKQNRKADRPAQWLGCEMMEGECKKHGIWEWRFFADGRQQRVLGIFGGNRKEAIFLIGCTHKQKVYTPPKCLPTAIKRAKEFRAGRARTRERQVSEDI
jgi:hypothetical protein